MMVEAFKESDLGVKVGGKKVRDVRFADYQAMIADGNELQEMLVGWTKQQRITIWRLMLQKQK